MLIVDALRLARDIGFPISNYRYVGMGANRFYDFLLLHKYLGISNMLSLEHDPIMFLRAEFNCPFKFIKVLPKSTEQFIIDDDFETSGVYWFDYDGGLSTAITNDIASISTKLKEGDFFFVTLFCGCQDFLAKINDNERYEWIKDEFGAHSINVQFEDAQVSNFQVAIQKIIRAAFKNAFAYHLDGQFFPFLRVKYRDSQPMITFGGSLLSKSRVKTLKAKLNENVPFLKSAGEEIYELKTPHLTEKERYHFDLVATNKNKVSKEKNLLLKLGFKEDEIANYQEILRYFPRYVETLV